MAAPRLPFLWPMLFRPTPSSSISCIGPGSARPFRPLSRSARTAQDSRIQQRYGAAHEPAPHLRKDDVKGQDKEEQAKPEKVSKAPVEEEEQELPQAKSPTSQFQSGKGTETPSSSRPDPSRVPESKPLGTVLHMPSPEALTREEEERKPPHLKTPRYVHHFDSFSLVRQLVKGGLTNDQSVTVMKAVRGILTDNMELAQEGLVSKSSVENETYLFRAACSELRTELGNNRKGETEKMRSERNQLQHEVDILSQRLGQETGHLKDELKGLFDDRKMAVRQEQRTMESKIQELNYKITVALNSDARSEVEGLRWVLTRRAAITVGVSAFMLFVALRYMSYIQHTQQLNEKKKERKPSSDEGRDNLPTNPSLNDPEAVGGELLAAKGGVSLG